jgi:hypothetical protein
MSFEKFLNRLAVVGLLLFALFLVGIACGTWHLFACDRYVLTGLAKHGDRAQRYNSVTTGLGCEYARGELRWGVRAFLNSHERLTVLPGAGWLPLEIGPARLGTSLGVAIGGYERTFTPAGAFTAEVMAKDVGIDLHYVPRWSALGAKDWLLWLGFKFVNDWERR